VINLSNRRCFSDFFEIKKPLTASKPIAKLINGGIGLLKGKAQPKTG
jgi:hypothetical protein